MRVLDERTDQKVDNISICLTREEALSLHGSLKFLLESDKGNHSHISSEDYQKEVTIYIYDTDNLDGFHPRFVKLIKEDQ